MNKLLSLMAAAVLAVAQPENVMASTIVKADLPLEQQWDKTFALAEGVTHRKVTFVNRYGITLAADLYAPAGATGKLPAIAVSGPFGAVKEQCSGLYAMTLAERGFLAMAFDPSFTGESGGEPRRMASPDINTDDFLAAVDYLSTLPDADATRIGLLGICGWGGLALNAAALDTRVRATVASTMYDISRVTANGYFDADDSEEARHALRERLSAQRTTDYAAGHYVQAGGVVDPLPDDAPQFVRDYYDYYKTPRGYHKRSGNSNDGWTVVGCQSFLNQPLLCYASEIRSAVLLVHGEKAHSRYFSETAYKALTAGNYAANKQLLIVPGASHCDLYDGGKNNCIPFDKITEFFRRELSND